MLSRALTPVLRRATAEYPVVTLTGPRQSGKTTLLRAELSDWHYVSLENPDERASAQRDPRGFLARFSGPVVLDEAQRAPDLFSYIQGIVDERGAAGQYVLSGSHNFLLLQSIAQTLAGRCRILHLLPFSLSELLQRPMLALDRLGVETPDRPVPARNVFATMFSGFFPRIHDRSLRPGEWLADYFQTYLERDVRDVLKVGDLEAFDRFVRLCAGRSAQLLNFSALAADCGVTHTTARRWLSVLEASFQVLLLRPFHRNFGKRYVRSPKLYLLDSGLLCFLLGIRTPEQLVTHPARGAVFESFVIGELYKNFVHRGELPRISYWRDARGREVDALVEDGPEPVAVEIKSGQTVADDFFGGLRYWRALSGNPDAPAALVYGGDQAYVRERLAVLPWYVL